MDLWTFFENDTVPARPKRETEELPFFYPQHEQQATATTPESSDVGAAAAAAAAATGDARAPPATPGAAGAIEAAVTAADAAALARGHMPVGGGREARDASTNLTNAAAAAASLGKAMEGKGRSETAVDEEGEVAGDAAAEGSLKGEAAIIVRYDTAAVSARAETATKEAAVSPGVAAAEAEAAEMEMRVCAFMNVDEDVEEKALQQQLLQQSSRSSTVQQEAEAHGDGQEVERNKEENLFSNNTGTNIGGLVHQNNCLEHVEAAAASTGLAAGPEHVEATAASPRPAGGSEAAENGAGMGGVSSEATAAEESKRAHETKVTTAGAAAGAAVAGAAAGTATEVSVPAGELGAAAPGRRQQGAEGKFEGFLLQTKSACSHVERKGEVQVEANGNEEQGEQRKERKGEFAWHLANDKELRGTPCFLKGTAESQHRKSSSSSRNSSPSSSSDAYCVRDENNSAKNDLSADSGYNVISDRGYSNSGSKEEETDNFLSSSACYSYVAATPTGRETHASSAARPVSITTLQEQEQEEEQWQGARQQQGREEHRHQEAYSTEQEHQEQEEARQEQPQQQQYGEKEQHEQGDEVEMKKQQQVMQVTGALPSTGPSSLLFAGAAIRQERDAAATAAAGDALCLMAPAAAKARAARATAPEDGSGGRRERSGENHQQPANSDNATATAVVSLARRGTYETATTADVVVIQTTAAQRRFFPAGAAADAAVAAAAAANATVPPCGSDAAAIDGSGRTQGNEKQRRRQKRRTGATSVAVGAFHAEGRREETAAAEKGCEEVKQIDVVRSAVFFEQLQQKHPATAAAIASEATVAARDTAAAGERGSRKAAEEARNVRAVAPPAPAETTSARQNNRRPSRGRSRRVSVASEEEATATSAAAARRQAATAVPPPQQQLQQHQRREFKVEKDEEPQELRHQERSGSSNNSNFRWRSSSTGSSRSVGRVPSGAAAVYPTWDSQKQKEISGEAWFQQRRHVFIFTFSGKPVYSRYALEGGLASLMGTLSAIVSKMENFFFLKKSPSSSDSLRYISAGDKRFVFLRKGPFYFVSVHDAAAAKVQQIKSLLFLMHRQLLCILTKGIEDTLYKRPSFDVSPLLGGTDGVLHKLLSQYFSSMLSVFLAAAPSSFSPSSSSCAHLSSATAASAAQAAAAAGRRVRFDAAFFLSASSSSSSSAAALAAASAVSAAVAGSAAASQKLRKGPAAEAGEAEAATGEIEGAADAEAAAAARESVEQQSIEALTAFEPLPLNATMRHIACNMLKHSPAEQVLANVLLADDRVVAIATAKYFTFQPTDLVLLTNFVAASPALRQAESWTPFCLPGLNDRAFVYMYVRFITPHVSFVSLSLKSDGDQFYLLSTHCTRTFALLSNTGCLAAIERSRLYSPYSLPGSLWGSLELLHVALLLPHIHQFFSSAFSSDLIASEYHHPTEHILQLYIQCEECVYHAKLPTHSYLETEREKVYVWRTHEFHFYAAVPSWTDLSTEVVEEVARWVLEQQPFLFLTNIPTITPTQNF